MENTIENIDITSKNAPTEKLTLKEAIELGVIKQDLDGKWIRLCPNCNNEIKYNRHWDALNLFNDYKMCHKCSHKNCGLKQSSEIEAAINEKRVWQESKTVWCRICPNCNKIIRSKWKPKKASLIQTCQKCARQKERHNSGIQTAIRNKIIWIENERWYRICIHCSNIVSYSQAQSAFKASIAESHCMKCYDPCVNMEKREVRRAIEEGIIKQDSEGIWYRNCSQCNGMIKSFGEQAKYRLTYLPDGKVCRDCMAIDWVPGIDNGSKEFFDFLNEHQFNFKTSYSIPTMRYIIDGFDINKHIILEYDSPYHRRCLTQKKKDLIRQNNIIQYYEELGNPLTSFIRVDANKKGEVLSARIVYESRKDISTAKILDLTQFLII